MELNSEQLLTKINEAKAGNQIAFQYLLDTFWPEIYGFLMKRTESESDAEDIAIQAFSKAFHKIDTFKPEYKFSTWLTTIAKNIHYDLIRKRKSLMNSNTIDAKDEAFAVVDNTPSIEDKLITEQNLAKLLTQIKQLKPNYQEIIHLRYFQEKSIREIAHEIGETENNVRVKLLRARKLLSEIIKKKN